MISTAAAPTRATLADLARVEGKAELIGGRIVPIMPTGDWPSLIAGEIFVCLRQYAKKKRKGRAYRFDEPSRPVVFHRGDVANAEPALPGWTMAVAAVFDV